MEGRSLHIKPFVSGFVATLLVMAAMSLAACEETVNPILDSDRQLTLWGTLDMNADTQYVRIVPIREILDVRVSEAPDVEVATVDLDNGERVEWSDSMLVFDGDKPAIIFYAPLRVVPTHTYRIEVSSPEYAFTTTAETTIPAVPAADISPEDIRRFVSPSGFTTSALQDVKWHDIGQMPYSIEHWYRFLSFGNLGFIDYKLPFVPPQVTYNPGAHTLDMKLNLVRHRDSVAKYIPLAAVRLVGMGQTITVLDDAFIAPGGEFDEEILAQPGTLSNVEHGFGFMGSIGRFSIEWRLADSSAVLLNYIPLSGFRPGKAGESTGAGNSDVLRPHPWTEPAEEVIRPRPTLTST